VRTRFSPASGDVATARTEALPATFANGKLVGSLPAGVRLGTQDEVDAHLGKYAAYDDRPFVALNTAFLDRIAVVRIERGAIVEEPLHFVNFIRQGEDVAAHPRVLVLCGANSQCTIVERFSGEGRYLSNPVTELAAGEGAVVDHYRVQTEADSAFHVGLLQAALGRSANLTATAITLGGGLVRNDVSVRLSEGSHAALNGLYIVNGSEHVDNHTEIDHAMPHATSFELYKGILDGKASAVFNGRIMVRKDAQKTDSKQTNKNLVLSNDAVIDTKPELQIFADDVRCTHGATIGQLDAEAMFYMQSRGIGKQQARSLLTYAFAQDIVDRVNVPSMREWLERVLFAKFNERNR
jgi:Fe-S cluster assembly protein SufD